VPTALWEMLQDKDKAKANRVMEEMMKMIRIEIEPLREAYNCRAPARWDHASASDMGPAREVINVGDVMISGALAQGQEVRRAW
jgi:hypothetical protein